MWWATDNNHTGVICGCCYFSNSVPIRNNPSSVVVNQQSRLLGVVCPSEKNLCRLGRKERDLRSCCRVSPCWWGDYAGPDTACTAEGSEKLTCGDTGWQAADKHQAVLGLRYVGWLILYQPVVSPVAGGDAGSHPSCDFFRRGVLFAHPQIRVDHRAWFEQGAVALVFLLGIRGRWPEIMFGAGGDDGRRSPKRVPQMRTINLQ